MCTTSLAQRQLMACEAAPPSKSPGVKTAAGFGEAAPRRLAACWVTGKQSSQVDFT